MTTYTNETHATTTEDDEIMGRDIRCNAEDIYCNNIEYDCCGNQIMNAEESTSTTYNKEEHL